MSGADWRMRTRRSPSPYGSGLSSTPLMTLKIAVLAPMPRPSVRIAISVKPRCFSSVRTPKRRSFINSSIEQLLSPVPVVCRHVTVERRQKAWQDVETMKSAFVVAFVLLALTAPAQDRPLPKKIPIADGVVLFTTAPYGDVGLDGNSIAILSRDGVFVFDTNGTPAAAAAVLAEIRQLTDRPVRYVVNSHWHWDHWYGTETYLRAFPDLRVIAHEKTRAMRLGPALASNKPGLETQLPAYIESLVKRVTAARAATPPPADLPTLEHRLAEDRFFLEQKTNVRHVVANV